MRCRTAFATVAGSPDQRGATLGSEAGAPSQAEVQWQRKRSDGSSSLVSRLLRPRGPPVCVQGPRIRLA